jgi:Flp pilus assembly pilin Flp
MMMPPYRRNRGHRGATLVEYALLILAIAVLAAGAFRLLGSSVSAGAQDAAAVLDGAAGRSAGAVGAQGTSGAPSGGGSDGAQSEGRGVLGNIWEFTKGVVVDGAWGTVTGLAGLGKDIVVGTVTAIAHPIDTAKAVGNGLYATGSALMHPVDTANSLYNGAVAIKDEIVKSCSENGARCAGNAAFQILTLPAVATKVAKVGQLGQAVTLVGRAEKAEEAAQIAAKAEEAAKAAKVREAEDAAKLAQNEKCVGGFCNRPGGACFAAGTRVETASGGQPIETLRVGDRVRTIDDGGEEGETSIDPATWADVRVRMPNPDGTNDVFDIELLKPRTWITAQHAAPGEWLSLEIPELGVTGSAQVESVGPPPAIAPGAGRVVTATFTHLNGFVHRLRFSGTAEVLEVTNTHRLFSVDRHDWVAVEDVAAGERLVSRREPLTVASNEQKDGVERVYNLEVETEHTYLVGDAKVLSHNATDCFEKPRRFPTVDAVPRDAASARAASSVASAADDIGWATKSGKGKLVVHTFVHEDGSVSVGISGKKLDPSAVKQLEGKLKATDPGTKYTIHEGEVSPALKDQIVHQPGGNKPGVCAEAHAAEAARQNPSPIVSRETLWRGQGPNPHPAGAPPVGKWEPMKPCPTCDGADQVYWNWANGG